MIHFLADIVPETITLSLIDKAAIGGIVGFILWVGRLLTGLIVSSIKKKNVIMESLVEGINSLKNVLQKLEVEHGYLREDVKELKEDHKTLQVEVSKKKDK